MLRAPMRKVVSGAMVKDVYTGKETKIGAEAVFLVTGHTPSKYF